ncbi:MAG: aldo/keto reductase [Hyphomicrobiales bacterium]|nr:aldo/keto reductase [Hyphomicrobiales bacterium]
MTMRRLGQTEIMVSPLCFGGNVFGWTADEPTSFALLDAFLAEGFNFIDTADCYSIWVPGHKGGESETIIGRWMKARGNRKKVVIATKVGWDMGAGKKGLTKAYIREGVEASLRRLQTDYIDLYQSHVDDASTPQEETLSCYAELIKAGKVRAIGASNFGAPRLAEALDLAEKHGLPRYETLQPLYNLYDREIFERELEPLCLARGIGVINYYSLAAGFLTGKYRTQADLKDRARGQRIGSTYLNDRGLAILVALDAVAAELRATPAQVALAWLMARPSITAPIASATSVTQFRELAKATRLKLNPAAIQRLDQASQWKAKNAA